MSPQPISSLHPTTAAGTAKHMTAVVFHPSRQPKKGDHPWLT